MATSNTSFLQYCCINAAACSLDEQCTICFESLSEQYVAGSASATGMVANAPTIEEFSKYDSLDAFTSALVSDAIVKIPQCGHRFHKHCVSTWLSEKRTCPLCRCELRGETDEEREEREAMEEAREASYRDFIEARDRAPSDTDRQGRVGWWDEGEVPMGYYNVETNRIVYQITFDDPEPEGTDEELEIQDYAEGSSDEGFESQGYYDEGNDRGYC